MESCSGSGGSFSTGGAQGGRKMERKDKERERRQQMKELCCHLSSLISTHTHFPSSSNSQDVMTQKDNLDGAVTYILKLKERVEELRELRDSKSISIRGTKRNINRSNIPTSSKMAVSSVPPVIEVRSEDTNLEVVLVCGLHNGFKLHKMIGILEEEGALVKNANFSVVSDKVFYTIHSQVLSPRIGVEASRVLERLQDSVS
ncbi:basic helix-loop-helix (bHLH) DNA-binding superfamily protein [Rhynchospora pubera]|uniref:Basic helix-loop-helix (BHLH) DNA-binding superfamily protein n=1 Tax=Rhynchospora pubera TaxID=906938 RepID=A0AAV8CAL8_9POAL|nr:basic helix-loop-helix (bHLH) DNA-binding superfamily protein [Rhynchospora pubera]